MTVVQVAAVFGFLMIGIIVGAILFKAWIDFSLNHYELISIEPACVNKDPNCVGCSVKIVLGMGSFKIHRTFRFSKEIRSVSYIERSEGSAPPRHD